LNCTGLTGTDAPTSPDFIFSAIAQRYRFDRPGSSAVFQLGLKTILQVVIEA
jgi:hypothetical protein